MSSQTTIERPVETVGIGLHTAVPGRIRLNPAPPDVGIVFRRVDLDNFEIEAHGRNVDRKSTRLNSSHLGISYAVICLKKKRHPVQSRDERRKLLHHELRPNGRSV